MENLQSRFALDERRWRELDPEGAPIVLLVPVGACEQHGPHLPLATDTLIAQAIALRCCPKLESVWRPLVTPPIAIAASGEHQAFPGTLSLGVEATSHALIELARSADWADRIIFVNAHGGNTVAVRAAVERSIADGRHWVSGWAPKLDGIDDTHGDLHAGWVETSVMLFLYPELVDQTAIEPGPAQVDFTSLLRDGVAAVSHNGVLGDPTTASAARGRSLVAAWVADLATQVGAVQA